MNMPRKFDLSSTPNTSGLMITRGEVQGNHVRNFGSLMRYGQVAIVSTAELEYAMPSVGLPPDHIGESSGYDAVMDHHRRCGKWVTEYVAKELALEPYQYDVHLIDNIGQPEGKDEDADKFTRHWRGVVNGVSIEPGAVNQRRGEASLLWAYKPFELKDQELEQFGQEEPRPILAELFAKIKAGLPIDPYGYATATLLEKRGDLEAADIEFSYPTKAVFERAERPAWGTVNRDGDHVSRTAERSHRSFSPNISVEMQIALADTRAKKREALEATGRYYSDSIIEDRYKSLFAPIYNLL